MKFLSSVGVGNGGAHRRCVLNGILLAALASQASLGQSSVGKSQPAPSPAPELFEEHKWESVCTRALAVPLPAEADALARSATAKPALKAGQCDELTLYYGFGKRPDYQAALRCAYRHRAYPNSPRNHMLEGSGTLAMLYANGDAVPRDYTLAIRFACEAATAGGQNSEQRIGVLEALRDGKLPSGNTFDLCEDR